MMKRMYGTQGTCWRAQDMCTTRWRSKSIQNSRVCLRVQLGVQDHLSFKLTHRTCTTSNLDVPHIHGKISREPFQRHCSHGQLKSKSPIIIKTRLISRTFLVLRHLFLPDGPCINLESIKDAS
jgi:hypothetical protein